MRKVIVAISAAGALILTPAAALADPNPSGSGQPSQECGESGATSEPTGFSTGGFATAEDRYAGSDGTASLASGNDAAVSQYDVACFQFTQAGR
jgi:hypothetical protein